MATRPKPQTSASQATALLLTLASAGGCALLGNGLVERVAGMHGAGSGPHPYFLPGEAALLYLGAPLVALASFLFFVAPGALLVLLAGRLQGAATWLLGSFGASLALCIALDLGLKILMEPAAAASRLLDAWTAIGGLAALVLLGRLRRGNAPEWPLEPADGRRLLWMAGAAWVLVAVLVPKIFWESFNLDGIEAFEFGRSLGRHLLPHWQLAGDAFGFYPNFVLFAYPNHWFLQLFGPLEAAVRLPFVLYVVLLFPALLLLIERDRPRPLRAIEEGLVWLALASYVVVQTFNTNYEPFYADLAEMAATDTLWVLSFLAACAWLWAGRSGWFLLFGGMTYLASPGGLLLLAALAGLLFVFAGPTLARARNAAMMLLGVCIAVGLLHELAHRALAVGAVEDQFGAKGLLRRLYPPTLTEFARFNAILFPSGLLPALSLFAVRRTDPLGWILAGVTAVYFGVLYLQTWTSLHQFAPVMVLPLVVFWRVYLQAPSRLERHLLTALAFATSLSLVLSLPRHFEIHQGIRELGTATRFEVGDDADGYEEALGAGRLLFDLLPEDYRMAYPEQPWGADPATWVHYALREKPPGTPIHYVVRPDGLPPPAGGVRVGSRRGASVYVLDRSAWQRDRDREYPRVIQSPLYEPIYRSTYRFFRAHAGL